jgi:Chaperone of endosialidase
MKKANQFLVTLLCATGLASYSIAQVSIAANSGTLANYVGWNSLQLFPLRIEHQGNQPINFSTNGTQKATLTTTGNLGLGIATPNYKYHLNTVGLADVFQQFTNGSTGVLLTDGTRLGLLSNGDAELAQLENLNLDFRQNNRLRQRFTNLLAYSGLNGIVYSNTNRVFFPNSAATGIVQAFSVIHAGEGSINANLQRNWMNVGATFTANQDILHLGLMERADPSGGTQTDAVITWGCQDNSPTGADNFRIIYIEPTTSLGAEAGVQGEEVFRIEPINGNVGIGNYSPTSLQGAGTAAYMGAKLDIDGDLRIRSVLQQDTLNRVLVIDQNDRNRVKWKAASTLGVCDWNIVNNGGTNDLATGYAGACVERNTGIGISAPIAKLDVVRGQTAPAIADPIALKVTSTDNPGIAGQTLFGLSGSPATFGTYSTATSTAVGLTNAIGGYFRGGGAKYNNVGVYGTYCQPNQTNLTSYAIYGYQPVPTNSSCAQGPGFAGYFNGDVRVINGDLTLAAAPIISSDESIKTDVAAMEGASEKLLKLKPVTYHLTNANCPNIIFPSDMQCGLIAQEVAEVFPEMVEDVLFPDAVEGSDELLTLKGVQYTELIPVLIAGFQEQNKKIQSLEEQLAACCKSGMRTQNDGDGSETINTKNITLGDKNSIVLNQNVPNPFAERTTISYNLPENVLKAQLMFYDQKGALINSQEIETRGAGIFNVFANDLSSGSYSYALVVDGKIIDTKTMVKTK